MRYIEKPATIFEVEQWFKNGDHSEDGCNPLNLDGNGFPADEGNMVRRYRHPEVPGDSICSKCKEPMYRHGWIDAARHPVADKFGLPVCPGAYIIKHTIADGAFIISTMPPDQFESMYVQYPKMNPAEALFGFMAWLTTREAVATFSSGHDAAPAVELLKQFCAVQQLGMVSNDWPNNFIPMDSVEIAKNGIIGIAPMKPPSKQVFNQLVNLLQSAATLVGNPGTNVSGSTDIACQTWQKVVHEFAQQAGLKIETYGPHLNTVKD
jgi:hypothetical protein